MLMAVEKGELHQFRGKSLDVINDEGKIFFIIFIFSHIHFEGLFSWKNTFE